MHDPLDDCLLRCYIHPLRWPCRLSKSTQLYQSTQCLVPICPWQCLPVHCFLWVMWILWKLRTGTVKSGTFYLWNTTSHDSRVISFVFLEQISPGECGKNRFWGYFVFMFLKNEWWFSRLWKTLRPLPGLQGGIGGPRKSVGTKSLRKHWALRIETDSKPRMWINDVAKEMDFIKVLWTLNDLHFKSSFGKRFLAYNEINPSIQ